MRPAGNWAAEKLDNLRRYIEVFEKSLRDKWQIRNYIDLLAGPGKNWVRETKEILLGSPLLALMTEFPFTGYYFIDTEPVYTELFRERCKASPQYERVHLETGDCNILVNNVVKELNQTENISLNLAFLDPEGLELHWNTVAKLASIRRMDLVINYLEGGLNRLMAKVFQAPGETLVDSFFGTKEWRSIYARFKDHPKTGVHRELIDLYKTQLQKLGYQEVKLGDDAGGEEPLMRNIQRNAPLYRLIFASKSPLGVKFWHEVTRRDIYGQKRLFDSR
jgi:three-Cys-motif partner protein